MSAINNPKTALVVGVVFLLLGACTPTDREESAIPSTSVLPSPVEETIPAAGVSTPAAETNSTPTHTSTLQPTPDNCADGFLAFAAQVRTEGRGGNSGVYIACADGLFRQRIMPFEYVAPGITAQSPNKLAVFADGSNIVFSYHDVSQEKWRVTLINLFDYGLTELFAKDYILRNAQPSPDGEYMAYLRLQGSDSMEYLEIVHMASQTVSSIVAVQSTHTSIYDFDWSPDGKRILLDTVGPLGQSQTWQAYIINIECDPLSHVCTGSNQTPLQNALRYSSWASVPSLIISAAEFAQDTPRIIRITDLEGHIIREVNLADIEPDLQSIDIVQPVVSEDGTRIAFMNGYVDIFILNLADMSVLNLTPDDGNVVYSALEWLP